MALLVDVSAILPKTTGDAEDVDAEKVLRGSSNDGKRDEPEPRYDARVNCWQCFEVLLEVE